MIVILDMGHDATTKGKRSPDKTFYEWEFNRKLGRRIMAGLKDMGLDVRSTTKESEDYKAVSLSTRAARVNNIIQSEEEKAILISIHADAYGDGSKWTGPRGWSVFVSTKASKESKELAGYIFDSVKSNGFKMRTPSPDSKYWTGDFTILNKTICPAVLTENLFYTNKEDLELLESDEHFNKLVNSHIEGIIRYINKKLDQ